MAELFQKIKQAILQVTDKCFILTTVANGWISDLLTSTRSFAADVQ